MSIILTGFTQDMEFRVFAFECVGTDRSRTPYTVKADLSLIRRYDIRMQELPLLCRSLIELREDADQTRTFTFTEDKMRACADERAVARAAAAQKRKPRQPVDPESGNAVAGATPVTSRFPSTGRF
jgi:hypothetical protein